MRFVGCCNIFDAVNLYIFVQLLNSCIASADIHFGRSKAYIFIPRQCFHLFTSHPLQPSSLSPTQRVPHPSISFISRARPVSFDSLCPSAVEQIRRRPIISLPWLYGLSLRGTCARATLLNHPLPKGSRVIKRRPPISELPAERDSSPGRLNLGVHYISKSRAVG